MKDHSSRRRNCWLFGAHHAHSGKVGRFLVISPVFTAHKRRIDTRMVYIDGGFVRTPDHIQEFTHTTKYRGSLSLDLKQLQLSIMMAAPSTIQSNTTTIDQSPTIASRRSRSRREGFTPYSS